MSHILVTDDDATTRQMIRGVLKKNGHTVTTVSDGVAALRAMQKKKFDLVLLDIWMPKMTGLGLLSRLHEEKHIPKIIVMTSDQTSDTLLTAMRGHVYQFLKKPLDAEILRITVDNALSSAPAALPIEVLSAQPHWVELLVPCEQSVVYRVQSFLSHLESGLPPDVVEKVGYAFRELLNNAIEWGGRLDPNLKVRISYIRTKKMLMYRLDDPGPGFDPQDLKHAALKKIPWPT
jgi:CheY-like chemotaxis protein